MSIRQEPSVETRPRIFPGHLAIIQVSLPRYRQDFFQTLADSCRGGLSVAYSSQIQGVENVNQIEGADVTDIEAASYGFGRFCLHRQKGVTEWLERIQPDALVTLTNPRLLSTLSAQNWMRRRRRPILAWGLGTMAVVQRRIPLRKVLRGYFLHRFDGIIAYSSRAQDEYRGIGISPNRIFVAKNAAVAKPTGDAITTVTPTDSPATVLYVGRLTSQKRVDVLIRACGNLPVAVRPRLVIVGDGPPLSDLKQLAAEVYPNTVFRGALFGEQLEQEYQRAHLFVLPGMGGLALQQAMSHGLPVIVGEGDGTQSDLLDPTTGWGLVKPEVGELSHLLAQALGDREKLHRMRFAAFNRIVNDVNIETMVDSFVRALNETLRSAPFAS